MKKKLEADLISIAHRILKLKNRAELEQLQAETLKLYEKLSVLRFVEDNFADAKPTIGYASAEGKLEEIYGIEEVPHVHANEVEAAENEAGAEKKAKKSSPAPKGEADSENKQENAKHDKDNEIGEGVTAGKEEKETEESGAETKSGQPEEGKKTEEEPKQETVEAPKEEAPAPETKEENKTEKAPEEPEQKVEVVKPAAEVKAMEEGAAAVYDKEDSSTLEEEEKAADAEIVTIKPNASAKTENSGVDFDFAFERKPAPEEPQKQKEISFEDYHNYKEPEFVKKDEKKEEPQQNPEEEKKTVEDDWRNWEPSKSVTEESPKQEEPKTPEPVAEAKAAAPKPLNDSFGKTISLGLNDRIAFEKHLFGGSSEDLNRVISQINTQNSFEEAKSFIEDLVKPDYNDWKDKEEYEERFMALVEKKFE